MIGNESVCHFIAFGFLPLPGLLSRDEALAIREELERLGHERGQVPGEPAMEAGGIGDVAAIGHRVRALLLDERVYDIPAKILGHDFTYEGSDAQWHVGDTPWHGASGVEQKPLVSIKVSLYLDDLDETNGCLRIIPGAHRNLLRWMDSRWAGVPDYLFPVRNRTLQEELPWGIGPQEVPHLPLPSRLGDACVFTEDLPHAAFGTKGVRRQLSFAFMANPVAAHQKRWVKYRKRHGPRDHRTARVRGVRRPAAAQDGRAPPGVGPGAEPPRLRRRRRRNLGPAPPLAWSASVPMRSMPDTGWNGRLRRRRSCRTCTVRAGMACIIRII